MLFLRSTQVLSKVCGVRFYQTSATFYKIVQFNLSDIGEGIREVTLKDWFVKVGDQVSQFDDLCLVESDKASVSITSRFDGTVKRLYYDIGEVALVGKPLVDIDILEENCESASTEPDKAIVENKLPKNDKQFQVKSSAPKPILEENHKREDQQRLDGRILTTPSVRRIAKEKNIDLSSVTATGKKGRVLKEDVLRYLENDIKTEEYTPQEHILGDKILQITGIKRAMVKTMTKSHSIPTFGYCDEVNMSNLIELRNDIKPFVEKKNIKLSFMPFFVKALSKAIEVFPELNSTMDENCENLTLKAQHNIGVAMDTYGGLIVPNIKNVQSLSILEISKYLNKLLEEGRSMKLGPTELTGGTITISNIGVFGGTYLRPLILPPEVCILALGKTKLTPVYNANGEIEKAAILTASWAADHRVIDGATLAKCSNLWKTYIENPCVLLMNL